MDGQVSREDAERQWWAEWWEADYSWAGLKGKSVPKDEAGTEETLQDYWRRIPGTAGSLTDVQLIAANVLEEFAGQFWHIAHLPLRDKFGRESSWKVEPKHERWRILDELIVKRIEDGDETVRSLQLHLNGKPHGYDHPKDRSAMLQGAVCRLILPPDSKDILHLHCRRAYFVGNTDASGQIFGPGSDFERVNFSGDVDLHGATLSGGARFNKAVFMGYTLFGGVKFCASADFIDTTYLGNTNFNGATFCENADFERADFRGYAEFRVRTFDGFAQFRGAKFGGDCHFTGANFGAFSQFTDARFNQQAQFFFAKFHQLSDFSQAIFSQQADFRRATFGGDANFNKAKFCNEANFAMARFNGNTGFIEATFEGNADFDAVNATAGFTMSGNFPTSESATEGTTSFRHAIFEGPVAFFSTIDKPEQRFAGAFYAARFLDTANFSGAVGEKQAGRLAAAFGEAQFEKALILTDGLDGKAGDGLHLTLIAGAKAAADDEVTEDERLAQLEAGCRTIKIAMARARDEMREQAYYRLQLLARQARSDIGRWEKGVGWVYGFFSDFGMSFWRPFLGLVGLIMISGLLYFTYASYLGIGADSSWDALSHGLSLAVRAAFSPFSILTLDPTGAATSSPTWLMGLLGYSPQAALLVRAATTFQSILGGILIFLFALAVRRRFQIG